MLGEIMTEHHTKYKEIHGYDETVFMSESDHRLLHRKLREEGKCNIPVEEMKKISIAAYQRTSKGRENGKKYRDKYLQMISFARSVGDNTQFYERITYNYKTGVVQYTALFKGNNGRKLPVIDIGE